MKLYELLGTLAYHKELRRQLGENHWLFNYEIYLKEMGI